MRIPWKYWSIISGILLASCSKPAGNDATLPVTPMKLDFAQSRPLLAANVAQIFPDFTLTDPELVPEPLIFGYGRYDANDLREPVIVRHVDKGWQFLEMPSMNHKDWVYAGAAYERNELWAILDSGTDSKDPGLYLFKSADKGQTWTLFSGVRPPTLQAEFVGFTLNAHGIGQITVHQDDDTDAVRRGVYAYATSDGGLTWTGPTFTFDDLISSETPSTPSLQEVISDLDPDGGPAASQSGNRSGTPGRLQGRATGRGR